MSLALIGHEHYLDHDSPHHPEHAERLRAIHAAIEANTSLNQRLVRLSPRHATDADVTAVHTQAHLDDLRRMAQTGDWADTETYVLPDSVEIAQLAAGGAIVAVDAVLSNNHNQAFALVRPPGHHATPNQAMGFCLLNNVAIAAQFARSAFGLKRIAIIDWDVHHGNGTQDIFYNDPDTLFISSHGAPLWPGSGHWRDNGKGAGVGTTINLPLRSLTGDMGMTMVFEQIVAPAVRTFKPELILISAGYDAHRHDPLGNLAVSTAGYGQLASIVYNLATECCNGRLVGILEGGYNLEALAKSVCITLETWLDGKAPVHAEPEYSHIPEPDVTWLVNALKMDHPLFRG